MRVWNWWRKSFTVFLYPGHIFLRPKKLHVGLCPYVINSSSEGYLFLLNIVVLQIKSQTSVGVIVNFLWCKLFAQTLQKKIFFSNIGNFIVLRMCTMVFKKVISANQSILQKRIYVGMLDVQFPCITWLCIRC